MTPLAAKSFAKAINTFRETRNGYFGRLEFTEYVVKLGMPYGKHVLTELIKVGVVVHVTKTDYSFSGKPIHFSVILEVYKKLKSYFTAKSHTHVQPNNTAELSERICIDYLKNLGYIILKQY